MWYKNDFTLLKNAPFNALFRHFYFLTKAKKLLNFIKKSPQKPLSRLFFNLPCYHSKAILQVTLKNLAAF